MRLLELVLVLNVGAGIAVYLTTGTLQAFCKFGDLPWCHVERDERVLKKTVTVSESDYDVDTGIEVRNGDRIIIEASGEIWAGFIFVGNNGLEGLAGHKNDRKLPLPSANGFSLLVKLDNKYKSLGQPLSTGIGVQSADSPAYQR